MTQIIYQIAEEVLVLHTADADSVHKKLAKYEPFLRPSLEQLPSPILEVWEGSDIGEQDGEVLLEEVDDLAYYSRVYRRGTGFRIEMYHQGLSIQGLVSSDWSRLELSIPLGDYSRRHLIDRLIMIAFSMATTPRGCLKVHASVIELSGQALIFLGVSGTGKSTHTRLWCEHIPGATLLNDDEPIVRMMPSGQVRVYGCPWSGSTPCYRDAWAEVAGFVMLRQAPFNKLEALSAREAFDALYSSCAVMHSCGKTRLQTFHSVADVLSCVRVYRLDNRPERAAVDLSYSILHRDEQ